MKTTGLCMLTSALLVLAAAFARFRPDELCPPATISTLAMLAQAVSCLGVLELKMHRRARSDQRRSASTLASALRNGVLR
jgi:hypothetical protein